MKKFARQARLPKGAYSKPLITVLELYMKKAAVTPRIVVKVIVSVDKKSLLTVSKDRTIETENEFSKQFFKEAMGNKSPAYFWASMKSDGNVLIESPAPMQDW